MGFTDVLKKAAPLIASAIPVPIVGQLAATFIGNAIGVPDLVPDKVSEAVNTASVKDPDVIAKLQQAEQAFQLEMKKMDLDSVEKLEELATADRANARAREVAVKDKMPAILAVFAVIGLYGVVAAVMRFTIPQAAHDLLLILIGSLVSNVTGVYTYYFGSSSGSAEKTKLLTQNGK